MFWKSLRKLTFWLHLATGATMGVVVLVMSVTGALLAYQRQLQYWADTRNYREAPAAGAARLPVEQLIAAAESSASTGEPARVTTVTYRSDPSHPVALAIGTKTFYANPYTGKLHGEGQGDRMRSVFASALVWHRYFGLGTESRTTGRAITGAANLGFLFLVLSGLYLWWPRSWTWPQVRNVVLFRRGLPWKAQDFNWHNVIGFWSVVPLAIVVYSGVVISYTWASNGVYRVMGEAPPVANQAAGRGQGPGRGGGRGEGQGRSGGGEAAPAPAPARASLTAMLETAGTRNPDWRILGLRVPAGAAPTTITVDMGDGGQPNLRGTLTMNSTTGAIETWAPFSDQTPGRRLRTTLRFLHTGEALGIPGQTIAGLVSAGAAVLVYSGFALALRRFFAWRRRPTTIGNSELTTHN